MSSVYLITGATGNVGRETAKHLSEAGETVIGARFPGEDVKDPLSGVEYKDFDFTDETTWEPALEGATHLFLMRPPHISKIKRDMEPFMRYLEARGIDQVVFLSVQGAEANKLVPHHKVEQTLRELDLPWTMVRPSFFMQNLSTTHLPEIRDENRIFVPAGEGRTNFIDVRDIGEVTAKILMGEGHIGKGYTITGERSWSYREVAERMSEILGKEIRYHPAGALPFIRYQRKQGRKLGHALVMLALYSAARMGKADGTTDAAEKILGRKPRSLDDFIRDHRALFVNKKSGEHVEWGSHV
ncbi:MAG: SDR family oxidoreductase [Spirochaetia bacterium]